MAGVSRRDVVAIAAIVICAMVAITVTAVVVTGSHATTSTAPPTREPLLPKLDDVLLDPSAVRGVLGGGEYKLNSEDNLLVPPLGSKLAVTPPECLPVAALATAESYADAPWLAARRSVSAPVTDVPGAPITVMQSVVIMPSADAASAFLTESLATWQRCQGKKYHFGPEPTPDFLARDVNEVAGTVVAVSVQDDTPSYVCIHVLSAKSRYVVGARTCGVPDGKAQELASKIEAKLPD